MKGSLIKKQVIFSVNLGTASPLSPVMCLNDGISLLGDVNARNAERTVPLLHILTNSAFLTKRLEDETVIFVGEIKGRF